jgi:hypothetical protein
VTGGLAGLTQLEQRREAAAVTGGRRQRQVPPPKNPKAAPPAPPPPAPAPPAAALETSAESAPELAADHGTSTLPAPVPPAPTAAGVKVTLYVDGVTDEFMEAARIEGLTARPKVDISRSAVVRLALRRLMAEMSPAEVKALLERQEVDNSRPGRKRR